MADVGHLIQSLLGDYYQPHYLTDQRLRDIDVDALFSQGGGKPRIKSGLTKAQISVSAIASLNIGESF